MVDIKSIENEEFLSWPVIGTGAERTCYQNPHDPSRCIKVSKKENAKQTLREIKYFEKLKKRGCSFEHIPQYYGEVQSEKLIGFEQQVILSSDRSIAVSLAQYILEKPTPLDFDEILDLLKVLKRFLVEYRIIPSDLVLSNILVSKQDESIKLYLIDGFGNTEFIPISDYFSVFNKKKIDRKFTRFLQVNLDIVVQKKESEERLKIYRKKIMDF